MTEIHGTSPMNSHGGSKEWSNCQGWLHLIGSRSCCSTRLLRLRRSFEVSIGFVEASCPSQVLPILPCSLVLSADHWIGVRCPTSPRCYLTHQTLLYPKHSTKWTRHRLLERPRRGESMNVTKSPSRLRFAEPPCFRLDAATGSLLVIAATVPCHVFCLPIPDLNPLITLGCASTTIRGRETPIVAPPRVGNSFVTTANSGTLTGDISTVTTTQLCLQYLWLNRDE